MDLSKAIQKVKMSDWDLKKWIRALLGIPTPKRTPHAAARRSEIPVPSHPQRSPTDAEMQTQAVSNRSPSPSTPPQPAHLEFRQQPPANSTDSSSRRIEWLSGSGEVSPPKPAPKTSSPTSSSAKTIDWVGNNGSTLQPLIGLEDAFDHTPLEPGEKIAFCKKDKVAYHYSTWLFLRAHNQGRCCICGDSNVFEFHVLPGTPPAPKPQIVIARPQVMVLPGEKIIKLEQVPEHIGRLVIVEDFVHEVYKTKSTGTIFVRFEPRRFGEPPFQGFKLVIFPDYQSAWERAGISIYDYAGKTIRVRGVVQEHPTWGIEILVNSPRVIEIVANSDAESDNDFLDDDFTNNPF